MFSFIDWIEKQGPKEDIPFRPGAKHLEGFGLRKDFYIGSPWHLGDDREAFPREIYSPFYGRYRWQKFEDPRNDAGSLLSIIPNDAYEDIVFQVFHTESLDSQDMIIEDECNKGELLPVQAGSLGLADGIHTHSVLMVRYSKEVHEELKRISTPLDPSVTTYIKLKMQKQEMTWGIEEITDKYAIRKWVGAYRTPQWPGKTICVDSRWALDI